MPCIARTLRFLLCLILLLLTVGEGNAHVGAPDVYVKANAGPYALLVSVHPPLVVPGTASIDVRTQDDSVQAIAVSAGNSASQALQRFSHEQIFTGGIWVAAGGAWRVTLHVSGSRGEAETVVPVPASASSGPTRFVASPLFWLLLMALLATIALAVRLPNRRVAVAAAVLIAGYLIVLLFLPAQPGSGSPTMQIQLLPEGRLAITLPGKQDDLVEDHGHLMHFFAVRSPGMGVLLHLHPSQTQPGKFMVDLPSMAGGAFNLYADVVHRDGTLETFTAQAGLPPRTGSALTGDDSIGIVPALDRTTPVSGPGSTTVSLPDGYRMAMQLDSALHPRTAQLLRFTLLDAQGHPPQDMQLYMGMAAHAAVFKDDGSVFAHIHPTGTVPMAAYGAQKMDMSGAPASEVSFPFGFPKAGAYRIFVEMKHGVIIETAAFDLNVAP